MHSQGGGGTLIFSAYIGSDPASTIHPKKISGISSTPKKYLKFYQPQKISQFCTLTLKRDRKLHRNDPQTSPILWWPPKKYPQNLHTPKKYSFFWKLKKILKFRILNPKKWAEPTYVWKYQSTPPGDALSRPLLARSDNTIISYYAHNISCFAKTFLKKWSDKCQGLLNGRYHWKLCDRVFGQRTHLLRSGKKSSGWMDKIYKKKLIEYSVSTLIKTTLE